MLIYVSASRYAALLFPDAPGAINDLVHSADLNNILQNFMRENSEFLIFMTPVISMNITSQYTVYYITITANATLDLRSRSCGIKSIRTYYFYITYSSYPFYATTIEIVVAKGGHILC